MFTRLNKVSDHHFYMKLAFLQAKKNLGNTSKNPSVGCVIVKNNNLISAGFTSLHGRPHAEVNAINFSKSSIKNSNLYVTLEPCSHYGKTSPCINLIIKKKVKKVYFSIKDPDKRSFNKSSEALKRKNISVKEGLMSSVMKNFYSSYLKFKDNNLPFVTGKIAISRDFYTANKKKEWITNIYSRKRGSLMRSSHDCIVTTSKTIIKDNPMLSCRINGLESLSPSRIIIDKNLDVPLKSKVITTADKYKTVIFYNKNKINKIKSLKKFNVKLIYLPLDFTEQFNLKFLLKEIKTLGFSRVFLESGLTLITNFLRNNLIDDFHLFISHKKLGKNGYNSFKKCMNLFLKNKKKSEIIVNLFKNKLITYKIK